MKTQYDIVCLGHYTKDTIISSSGTRHVNGGGFNYGSHVVAAMGLKVAAITKLAREDHVVVDELEKIGVDTYVTYTPKSTCFTLEYPSSNPDERVIYVHSTSEPFTPKEVENISAKAIVISPSIRGEVPEEVVDTLRAKNMRIALDVQGFIRWRFSNSALPPCERVRV
jgi:sugar/nucleoside kinase (ribokinase family)